MIFLCPVIRIFFLARSGSVSKNNEKIKSFQFGIYFTFFSMQFHTLAQIHLVSTFFNELSEI